MTNRIHLQQMALKKEKIVRVAQFDDACTRLISERYPQMLPGIASRFDDLYYAYLLWNKDQNDCRLNSEESLLMMKRLLDRKGKSLEWLVEIPIADVPDVHLHDIWGAADENAQNLSVYVSRAYTAEGRKRITDFLVLMYKIGLNKEIGGEVSDKFWDWYWPTFFESWLEFTVSFDSGIDFLVEEFAKKYMLALMTTSQNPYFRLLDRMSDEFSRDVQKSRLPPWAALVLSLKEIRHTAKVEAEKAKGKLTGKLEDVTERLVEKTREIGAEKNVKEYENRLEIAGVWKNYEKALAQLLPATTSHEVCFNMVSDYFKQESGEKIPAFLNVHNEAFKLKSMTQEYGDAIAVWDIVLGPLNFLLDYGIMDAECTLQKKWEEQILGTIKSAGSDKVSDVLFNKSDGIVWKFVSGPAQPFVMKSKKGYIARKSHDLTIPFNSDFFDFLNVGERNIAVLRSDYVVTMETLPLTVNNGANIKPYGNVISLNCPDKEVSLENYNYPQSRIFHWKPDKCGGVIVRIFLPDLVLTKTYKGPMAFPSFLSEFGDGTRTFRADEFPDEKKRLSDMGISWIRLSYSISGKEEIVELLKSRAVQAPDEIVPCLLR
jgi:type VI secretion system protein ImpL